MTPSQAFEIGNSLGQLRVVAAEIVDTIRDICEDPDYIVDHVDDIKFRTLGAWVEYLKEEMEELDRLRKEVEPRSLEGTQR